MKICLINGSPKLNNSASGKIIAFLEQRLGAGHNYIHCTTANAKPQELVDSISGCNAIIIAFPLYADGIPSRLLRLLISIETSLAGAATCPKLYVIINNGYYEARQNKPALDMMRIFCKKAGFEWGQGVGIGGGGMIHTAATDSWLTRNMFKALDVLAQNILSGKSAEDILSDPNIPRFIYILAGNMGWKNMARKNGINLKKQLI